MRSISGSRNRWVLLVAGLVALVVAGWLGVAAFGLSMPWPQVQGWFAKGDATPASLLKNQAIWAVPAGLVLSILAVIAGLALLYAQIPARPTSSPLRLSDGGVLLATVEPGVLERSIAERIESVAGVLGANVNISGAVRSTWVQATVTIAEDAEAGWAIDEARARIAGDIHTALGHAPKQVDVLVHLRSKGAASSAEVPAELPPVRESAAAPA